MEWQSFVLQVITQREIFLADFVSSTQQHLLHAMLKNYPLHHCAFSSWTGMFTMATGHSICSRMMTREGEEKECDTMWSEY